MIYRGAMSMDIPDGIPTKYLTKEEFAALSEEEKAADVLYIVDEAPWVLMNVLIQEYDTDDGWHVRKYSDGYVEMMRQWTQPTNFQAWSSAYSRYISDIDVLPFPITLLKIYKDAVEISANQNNSAFPTAWVIIGYGGYDNKPVLLSDGPHNNPPVVLNHFVVGRWK